MYNYITKERKEQAIKKIDEEDIREMEKKKKKVLDQGGFRRYGFIKDLDNDDDDDLFEE